MGQIKTSWSLFNLEIFGLQSFMINDKEACGTYSEHHTVFMTA